MEYRNTPQRKLVLDIVKNRRDHPSADEVYNEARRSDPHISRGTIYRNLKLLSEQGLIRHVRMAGGVDRFDCRLDDHFHFICEKCDKVIDVNIPPGMNVDSRIVPPEDAEVHGHWVILRGLCSECRGKENR